MLASISVQEHIALVADAICPKTLQLQTLTTLLPQASNYSSFSYSYEQCQYPTPSLPHRPIFFSAIL